MSDDKQPVPVEAAGGVVYKRVGGSLQVLMIFRRDVWDLPKGKIDRGESRREAAIREVAEETGSEPPQIEKKIAVTIHTYTDEWGYFTKTTHWYAMRSPSQKFSPQTNEDITKVCWINLDRAMEIAGFDNLKEVLAAFKKWAEGD